MDVEKALRTRRSVRRYLRKPVPRDVLCKLVELCRFAPSAGNRQEWEIVLVDDARTVEGVFDTLAWLPAVGPPPAGQRPAAYVVVISNEKSNALADCASVTTYLLLAAHSMGLGSCWFGSISRTELSDMLGIPDNYSVEFVVALGYPDENAATVDSDSGADIEVTEEMTRVPKRKPDDIIHMNSFGNRC